MEEPSVLDYIKAKLTPWRGPAPELPPASESEAKTAADTGFSAGANLESGEVSGARGSFVAGDAASPVEIAAGERVFPQVQAAILPWRTLAALFLALVAQSSLEPQPDRIWTIGAGLYAFSFLLLMWAYLSKEWSAPGMAHPEVVRDERPIAQRNEIDSTRIPYNPALLMISLLLTLAGLWVFRDNLFTWFNLAIWLGALILVVKAFWITNPQVQDWPARLGEFLRQPGWKVEISRQTLPLLAAALLVIFFRVHRLEQVPPQMVSDHAEKLLDVWDVLQGQTSVFFQRNTGREGLQMYLTAGLIELFGLQLDFLSLKIGTVLAGLLTLPYIYLLGKETGGPRVGLLAMVFAGVAYWPNVISRVALRFTLYPLFVAPVLYYLIRGLRTSNRNDFILAGVFLGIGLHGYSPIRVLPIVVVVAVGLYLLHRQAVGLRRQTLFSLGVLALVSLIAFLPLLSYALQYPESYGYRALSRVGPVERPLSGPALPIFMGNLWNALTMFAWDNGSVWPVSVNSRPALDVVSGALFHLGAALLLVRYLLRRHWIDLFLLLSIPLLMMPSILSLAFPEENPILNRTAGALVPVFLIIGIALDGMMKAVEDRLRRPAGPALAWGLAGLLLIWSSTQNYELVFHRYRVFYEAASWNTSEMGQVIRSFSDSVGDPDSAWVIAYPHWVDTRLVGMQAGYPTKDYALERNDIGGTLLTPGPKLFLVKQDDLDGVERLHALYPQGWLQEYHSRYQNKNFLMFFVPPQQ